MPTGIDHVSTHTATSGLPTFGRGIDGNINITGPYRPSSERNGHIGQGTCVIVPGYLGQVSFVTVAAGSIAPTQRLVAPGIAEGTTITKVLSQQHTVAGTVEEESPTVTIGTTEGLVKGQFAWVGDMGYAHIVDIPDATTVTLSAKATASASVACTFFTVASLSKPAAISYAEPFHYSYNNTLSKVRAVDMPWAKVSAVSEDGVVLTVVSVSRMGSVYDFYPEDICLLINLQGNKNTADIGNYEVVHIKSIGDIDGVLSPVAITLESPLTKSYGDGKIYLIRLAEYGNVTITGHGKLTEDPWNGDGGGVVAALISGTLTCSGTGKISGDALGYRSPSVASAAGEGTIGGYGIISSESHGNGGGGGYNVSPSPELAGHDGGTAEADAPIALSGGSGGGAGSPGGGGGGGGGHGSPGGAGPLPMLGGGGACGGVAPPTRHGPGKPTNAIGVPSGYPKSGVWPAPYPWAYGAAGAGGTSTLPEVTAPAGGGAVGSSDLDRVFFGGAGGTAGTSAEGGAGGASAAGPMSHPKNSGGAGMAGGMGGGYQPGDAGGTGGGIVMLFAREIYNLNATCLGGVGSPGNHGSEAVDSPTQGAGWPYGDVSEGKEGYIQYMGNGGAGGGGGGGGGCGSGAAGTIFIAAEKIHSVEALTVEPTPGPVGGRGGEGIAAATPMSCYAHAGTEGHRGGAGGMGRIKIVLVPPA